MSDTNAKGTRAGAIARARDYVESGAFETDLARRAEYERSKLVGESGDNSQGVQWIDSAAFARMSPPPMNAPPVNYQPAPAYNQPATARGATCDRASATSCRQPSRSWKRPLRRSAAP